MRIMKIDWDIEIIDLRDSDGLNLALLPELVNN